MAEEKTAGGGIDLDALGKLIASNTASAVAEAVKPLHEAIAKLKTEAPAAAANPATTATTAAGKAEENEKPLTAAQLAKFLDDRDQQRSQQATARATRDKYVAEKMKDLPPGYARQMPETDDLSKLQAAEQQLRGEWTEFAKAQGFAKDVSGAATNNGTAATRTPVDTSKMNSSQLLDLGMKQRGEPRLATAADVAGAK